MEQSWFEMATERRRRFDRDVWIPIRRSNDVVSGRYGRDGYTQMFEGVATIAVPFDAREQGNALNWNSSMGLKSHSPCAWEDGRYLTAEQHDLDGNRVGLNLALIQHFTNEPAEWHLNQDLVLALGLRREGDVWVSPEQGYEEQARLLRAADGKCVSLEVRSGPLRDYLRARGMALRIMSYRSRVSVESDASAISWEAGRLKVVDQNGRFEGAVLPISANGRITGETAAVFHVHRTDEDMDVDVPVLGAETNENTTSRSWTIRHEGTALQSISGQHWRDEWLEPAPTSPIVRGDHFPSATSFIVEADGTRVSADDLNDEDIGRWLWFDPRIVLDLLHLRHASLEWYSRDTGGIDGGTAGSVHFGMNSIGLLTAHAYDVARLPEWQRRLWMARNVAPNGGVSEELIQAQVRVQPAHTRAPEADLPEIMAWLSGITEAQYGFRLFREREDVGELLKGSHRFRSVDRGSLLALAKDAARLTADLFDIAGLRKAVAKADTQKLGSLKLLEVLVSGKAGEEAAQSLLSPLFGIYDLRLADAHLPRTDIADAYLRARVNPDEPFYFQGVQLMRSWVGTLVRIGRVLAGEVGPGQGAQENPHA